MSVVTVVPETRTLNSDSFRDKLILEVALAADPVEVLLISGMVWAIAGCGENMALFRWLRRCCTRTCS